MSVTGPGARGVRIVEAPGDALAPVEDPDARAVVVRGVTGRFSPTLDELTWTEQGHVIVMSTHTVSLDDLLALADSMRWSRDPARAGGCSSPSPGSPLGMVAALLVDTAGIDPGQLAELRRHGARGRDRPRRRPSSRRTVDPATPGPPSTSPAPGPGRRRPERAPRAAHLDARTACSPIARPGAARHARGRRASTIVRGRRPAPHRVVVPDRRGRRPDRTRAGTCRSTRSPSTRRATRRSCPAVTAVAAALSAPGSAVLGQTSAELRHAEVGSTLEIGGRDLLTVTAIVPDADIAAAELVVSYATGARLGITTERAALVRYTGESGRARAGRDRRRCRRATVDRFRSPGETTYLRHGDAVLPQSLVKQRFGEFAVHPLDGTALEIDPAWVSANIVVADLPVLGRTQCNRQIVPMVKGALQELADAGLTGLVDPAQFGGCYNPRLIGPGLGLSRHTWGIALDVNVAANPLGRPGRQDPRLVEIMRRWGLAWGGDWLRPDPMHFEYLTPPRIAGERTAWPRRRTGVAHHLEAIAAHEHAVDRAQLTRMCVALQAALGADPSRLPARRREPVRRSTAGRRGGRAIPDLAAPRPRRRSGRPRGGPGAAAPAGRAGRRGARRRPRPVPRRRPGGDRSPRPTRGTTAATATAKVATGSADGSTRVVRPPAARRRRRRWSSPRCSRAAAWRR